MLPLSVIIQFRKLMTITWSSTTIYNYPSDIWMPRKIKLIVVYRGNHKETNLLVQGIQIHKEIVIMVSICDSKTATRKSTRASDVVYLNTVYWG